MRPRARGGVRPRVAGLAYVLAVLVASGANGASGADQAGDASRDTQTGVFDFGPTSALLQSVVRRGCVDYRRLILQKSSLDACIAAYADTHIDTRWSSAERLAFWINAYNLNVLACVVDHYPIESIRDIPGFFDRIRHRVAREDLTLDEIDAMRIRKGEADPRVHFALVCAAASCPDLKAGAYVPATLADDLEAATRAFLADTQRAIRVDPPAHLVMLSSLFDWFHDDFTARTNSLRDFLHPYLSASVAQAMNDRAFKRIYMPYDWSLNDADRARQTPVVLARP